MAIPPSAFGDDHMTQRQFGSSSTLVQIPTDGARLGQSGPSGMSTSRRMLKILALLIAGTFLQSQNAAALTKVTLVVSKGVNCWPQVKGPLYPTINAAIAAMPAGPNGVNTIIVCPGIYPEQVLVTKNVTIMGALRDGTDPESENGNAGEARIVPPPGGLITNVVAASGNVAAQVAVVGIADVNLINLTIEGADVNGNYAIGCPVGAGGVPVRTAGIALYNVGATGTGLRGTVSKTVVHNQIGYCPSAGGPPVRSYTAEGILAENSWFTLDSNSISNVDLNPIHQRGGISIITGNSMNFAWHGIVLTNVTNTSSPNNIGSTVSSNEITSFTTGIQLDGSSNVLVSENTVLNWTTDGIELTNLSSNNDIVSNRIVDAWHGIYLNNGSSGNTVSGNTIIRSVKAAIVDAFSDGGNHITGNTINQAPIGVFILNSAAGDVINPNDFFNVTVLTSIGSSVP